jgi:YidC/Oxa1 family membrane protein insertase
MIKSMPYIFLFLFASFPAGLVIYWSWSNTLSILQQWVIIKQHDKKRAMKAARLSRKAAKNGRD